MGGGGGYSSSPNDSEYLQNKAKEKLKQQSTGNSKNVFISFAYEDLAEVNLLRGQAKNDNLDLDFSDYSVKEPFNSKNSEYIKRQISKKIDKTSVTIVYLSQQSMKSDWVKWEVEQSIKKGKGVIGVYKGDKKPGKIPDYIKKNASSIVKWQHLEIMSAINKAANNR